MEMSGDHCRTGCLADILCDRIHHLNKDLQSCCFGLALWCCFQTLLVCNLAGQSGDCGEALQQQERVLPKTDSCQQ